MRMRGIVVEGHEPSAFCRSFTPETHPVLSVEVRTLKQQPFNHYSSFFVVLDGLPRYLRLSMNRYSNSPPEVQRGPSLLRYVVTANVYSSFDVGTCSRLLPAFDSLNLT